MTRVLVICATCDNYVEIGKDCTKCEGRMVNKVYTDLCGVCGMQTCICPQSELQKQIQKTLTAPTHNWVKHEPSAEIKVTKSTDSKGYATYSYNDTTIYAKCRHVETSVFEQDGIEFFGGSRYHISVNGFGAIINGSGTGFSCKSQIAPVFSSLYSDLKEPDVSDIELDLDWRDYGSPPVLPMFWKNFIAICKKNKVKKVLCCCMGGHGRTGTALASISVAFGYEAHASIEMVRERMCNYCIESLSQEKYIYQLDFELNQRPVPDRIKNKTYLAKSTSSTSTTTSTNKNTDEIHCVTCEHRKVVHGSGESTACLYNGCECSVFKYITKKERKRTNSSLNLENAHWQEPTYRCKECDCIGGIHLKSESYPYLGQDCLSCCACYLDSKCEKEAIDKVRSSDNPICRCRHSRAVHTFNFNGSGNNPSVLGGCWLCECNGFAVPIPVTQSKEVVND